MVKQLPKTRIEKSGDTGAAENEKKATAKRIKEKDTISEYGERDQRLSIAIPRALYEDLKPVLVSNGDTWNGLVNDWLEKYAEDNKDLIEALKKANKNVRKKREASEE